MKIREIFIEGDLPRISAGSQEMRVDTGVVIAENEHLITWSFATIPNVFSICVYFDRGKLVFNLIRSDASESFYAGGYRLFVSLLSIG